MTNEQRSGEASLAFVPRSVLRPREQVETQLRNAILRGDLVQGDRLPSESMLAQQFSVSRPTVREALSTLREKGFITKSAGARGGTFIRYVDHHALQNSFADRLSATLQVGSVLPAEVIEFRNLVEVPSARLAAVNRTDEHVAALRDVIDREKAISVFDPEAENLNSSFHIRLAEASGNRILVAVVTAIHNLTHPMALVQWTPEAAQEGVRHHIAIVRAVSQQDEEAAAVAMRDHLDFLARISTTDDASAGAAAD